MGTLLMPVKSQDPRRKDASFAKYFVCLYYAAVKIYPSQLVSNALLIAVAVHPREDCPLLCTLRVVQNEAGGEQHVVGELIALHLKP